MKKLLLLGMFLTTLTPLAQASEQSSNMYVSPKIMWMRQKIERPQVRPGNQTPFHVFSRHDESWGGALAVGYNLGNKCTMPIRAEIELAMRESLKTDNAKIETDTLFFNVYYDIKNSTPLTPYVGAGIGLARTDFKIVSFEKSTTSESFAWNIGLGASYKISNKIHADLGYRYVDYGKSRFAHNIGGGQKLKVHGDEFGNEILAGVRYSF